MRQCNKKTKKLDEIHRNSYEFRTNCIFPEYSHKFIHVKFVRTSYELHTNFTQISSSFPLNKANTQASTPCTHMGM